MELALRAARGADAAGAGGPPHLPVHALRLLPPGLPGAHRHRRPVARPAPAGGGGRAAWRTGPWRPWAAISMRTGNVTGEAPENRLLWQDNLESAARRAQRRDWSARAAVGGLRGGAVSAGAVGAPGHRRAAGARRRRFHDAGEQRSGAAAFRFWAWGGGTRRRRRPGPTWPRFARPARALWSRPAPRATTCGGTSTRT